MSGKHRVTKRRVQVSASILTFAIVAYVIGFLLVKHPGFSGSSPDVASTLRYVTATGEPSSHNVTNKGPGNSDPTELVGKQYECTMTDPEMTLTDDSENGTVSLISSPGSSSFSIASGGSLDYWNDAYLSTGNNSYGYNSAECNNYGGHSLAFPVSYANLPGLSASTTMSTGNGFKGDAGFDIWLTGNGQYDSWGTTSKDIQGSENSTEVMVWLNSPGIDRGGYTKIGKETIGGITWNVFYYNKHRANHLWNYVVFATDDVNSSATTFTYQNIPLASMIGFTISKGLAESDPVVQSVNAGFEWSADPSSGTGVHSYSLSETGGASLPSTSHPVSQPISHASAPASCSG